jgi:hypothetical protein
MSLVDIRLSPGKADLDLDAVAVAEIHAQGDEGVATLLDLAVYLVQLIFVQQQLPVPLGFVVGNVPARIGADVGIHEIKLGVPDLCEGVVQVRFAFPQGLDLRPGQRYARLVLLLYRKVVIRLSIAADDLHNQYYSIFEDSWQSLRFLPGGRGGRGRGVRWQPADDSVRRQISVTGSPITIMAPWGVLSFTLIRPPCSRMMEFTMARPRPVPWGLRVK